MGSARRNESARACLGGVPGHLTIAFRGRMTALPDTVYMVYTPDSATLMRGVRLLYQHMHGTTSMNRSFASCSDRYPRRGRLIEGGVAVSASTGCDDE